MTTKLRPLSPQTVQQQQSRLAGMLMLLIVCGPPALIAGGILSGMARATRTKRALAWLALAGLVGLGVLGFTWPLLWAEVRTLGEQASPLLGYVRPASGKVPPVAQLLPLLAQLWPGVWRLWCQLLLASPMIALYIFSTRVKTAEDLERERIARLETRAKGDAQKAAERSAKAPEAAGGSLVFGVPVGGDLDWVKGSWFTYPAAQLGRHLVLIGASNTGKTETSKRLAYGAAKVYGWRVFYLDCKGDSGTAAEFLDAMRAAGRDPVTLFPDASYDGWRGDSTAILNRLLAVLDYTEPYYRDMTKLMLSLAVDAPPGPPRSSDELLERLSLDNLLAIYNGRPEARELTGIRKEDAQAAYNRYRSFFRSLRGGLDGSWAFEDMQAGYILLKGLELRDQTASLGRYLLEDFAHYVSARKPHDERVLFIIDEFPAIAFGGANAATLFEMVRFRGAGIVVTAQSYAGMGADADRILGAAAGLVIHQCADPERLLPRAGQSVSFQRRVGFAERGMGAGAREYAVGEGTLSASEELKIHADLVKRLQPGECFVIVGGAAQLVRVSRLLPAMLGKSPPVASREVREPQPDAPEIQRVIEDLDAAQRRRYRGRVAISEAEPGSGVVEGGGPDLEREATDSAGEGATPEPAVVASLPQSAEREGRVAGQGAPPDIVEY